MGDKGRKVADVDIIWDGKELDWMDPGKCREYLRGVGTRYLVNKYFEGGFEKIISSYNPGRKYVVGLIVPCSYGKPYSQSYIHYLIRSTISDFIVKGYVHEIVVTNVGVVPHELDEYWPYCAYDWNPKYETEEIKRLYTDVLAGRLKRYIRAFKCYYEHLAAYLRWDSDSWRAVEIVSGDLGIEIPNLAPRSASEGEVEEASLNGLYDDPDLILITRSSTSKLRRGLSELIRH